MAHEEDLEKMAEWIVTHPPDIGPELVGSKLADAEATIDTMLHGEQRAEALMERSAAVGWLRNEALLRGYPMPGRPSGEEWVYAELAGVPYRYSKTTDRVQRKYIYKPGWETMPDKRSLAESRKKIIEQILGGGDVKASWD